MTTIEKGMYVRTNYGIAKVERVTSMYYEIDKDIMLCNLENYMNCCTESDLLCEPSFDIMDVIKEGDYINGHKISCITEERLYTEDDQLSYEKQSIKAVVTKEQFESMMYKIEKEVLEGTSDIEPKGLF